MRLLLLIPTSSYRTEAFVEAARRLGVDLTVASELDSTLATAGDPGLLTLEFGDLAAAVEAAVRFAATHPLHGVVGVDDGTVVVAARIADALGLPHHSPDAAAAAGSKYRQRAILGQAGVPVPDFRRISIDDDPVAVAGSLAFPVVLKPLHLSASRGVMRADSAEEFTRAHARLLAILREPDVRTTDDAKHFLVESFVAGPEYALEGLVVAGRLHQLALFDKPDPLDGPFFEETIYTTPSRASADVQQALLECAARAVAALGLTHGPVHVELRHNEAGPWVVELAARSIGGRCARALRFGPSGDVSLEDIVIGAALSRIDVPPQRESAASGVMMVPIPQPGWLSRVEGVERALAVPRVRSVEITVHPGQSLRTLPEESRYLGFITAAGESPDRVEAALRAAHQELRVVMGRD